MKKLFTLFAVLAMAISASAFDFEVDGLYFNVLSEEDATCVLTSNDNFYNAYSGDIVVPATVTTDGKTYTVVALEWAFRGCLELESVELPNTVVTIGNRAFADCWKLKTLTIPNSVKLIDLYAISECDKLESIIIGSSVEDISFFAFCGCDNLTEIINLNTTPPSAAYAFQEMYEEAGGDPCELCTIKVPAQAVEAYKKADGWKDFHNIVALSEEEYEALSVEGIQNEDVGMQSAFDLQGRKVGEDYKGVVVRGGKKYLMK